MCNHLELDGWYLGPGRKPTVVIQPHRCDAPSAFRMAFDLSTHIALGVEAYDIEDDPTEHPLILIHLNPGWTYSHEWCSIFEVCAACHIDLFAELFSHDQGIVATHAPAHDLKVLSGGGSGSGYEDEQRPPHQCFADARQAEQHAPVGTLGRPFALVNRDLGIEALHHAAQRLRLYTDRRRP